MSNTTETERYRELLASLISSASYARALSEVSSSSDIDFLGLCFVFCCFCSLIEFEIAKVLLDIANATNKSQQLIKELIYFEISKYQHMPTTIFRSNSLARYVPNLMKVIIVMYNDTTNEIIFPVYWTQKHTTIKIKLWITARLWVCMYEM